MFAHCLTHEGILKAIQEQVRFARARMGTYELIDFVAVVIGYRLSGEPTLQAFYERLAPFAEPFMSLFECPTCLATRDITPKGNRVKFPWPQTQDRDSQSGIAVGEARHRLETDLDER